MSDVRELASIMARASRTDIIPTVAVGVVAQLAFTAGSGEAQVQFGFSPDLIPIASSSWTTTFVQRVQAGSVVGRRVRVDFSDLQPIITDTMGA